MASEERKAYRKEWRLKRISEDPEYLIKRRIYINNRYSKITVDKEKSIVISPEKRKERRKRRREELKKI